MDPARYPASLARLTSTDENDCLLWSSFARRGLGYSAIQIDCDTLQPLQYAITTPTDTPGEAPLTYNAALDRYQYLWEPDVDWAGTCRQFILILEDGRQHRANFRFT